MKTHTRASQRGKKTFSKGFFRSEEAESISNPNSGKNRDGISDVSEDLSVGIREKKKHCVNLIALTCSFVRSRRRGWLGRSYNVCNQPH